MVVITDKETVACVFEMSPVEMKGFYVNSDSGLFTKCLANFKPFIDNIELHWRESRSRFA